MSIRPLSPSSVSPLYTRPVQKTASPYFQGNPGIAIPPDLLEGIKQNATGQFVDYLGTVKQTSANTYEWVPVSAPCDLEETLTFTVEKGHITKGVITDSEYKRVKETWDINKPENKQSIEQILKMNDFLYTQKPSQS